MKLTHPRNPIIPAFVIKSHSIQKKNSERRIKIQTSLDDKQKTTIQLHWSSVSSANIRGGWNQAAITISSICSWHTHPNRTGIFQACRNVENYTCRFIDVKGRCQMQKDRRPCPKYLSLHNMQCSFKLQIMFKNCKWNACPGFLFSF